MKDRIEAILEDARKACIQLDKQAGAMTIGDIIDAMTPHISNDWETFDTPDVILSDGTFPSATPISYRGYYDRLALVPGDKPADAREILRTLRGCIGEHFEGYKGGSYRMDRDTLVHIAPYGMSECPMIGGVEFVRTSEYECHFVFNLLYQNDD